MALEDAPQENTMDVLAAQCAEQRMEPAARTDALVSTDAAPPALTMAATAKSRRRAECFDTVYGRVPGFVIDFVTLSGDWTS